MVYGSGLENRRGVTHRGFESHPLRHRFINHIASKYGGSATSGDLLSPQSAQAAMSGPVLSK